MDELDNHPLSLLLLLDQGYFSQFLEWAQLMGWVDAVLFLLEADFLRFKSNDYFRCLREKINMHQCLRFLTAGEKLARMHSPIPACQLAAMQRLVESRIPLHAAFSQVCDSLWRALLRQGRMLASSQNTIWPSLKRQLIETSSIPLDEVLSDPSKRKYLEKFLQVEPADLACLQCFVTVVRIFDELAAFTETVKMETETKKKSTSILKRWRSTGKATFGHGHGTKLSAAAMDASMHATANRDLNDPYGAFRVLLKGTRAVQKQYFPVAPSAGSAAHSSSILGLNFNRSRRTSSSASISSTSSLPPIIRASMCCSGLSDALRMEIAACVTLNASVRIEDVDIIDPSYAIATCHILEAHLHSLQKELHLFLVNAFHGFQQSNEYVTMAAHAQALQCPAIGTYYNKLGLLSDFLSDHADLLHWADPRARGVMFLKYESRNRDHEDGERQYMRNSCGDIIGENTVDFADVGLEVPCVLGVRLDMCLAEDSIVTRDHAHCMPHRMRVWANNSSSKPSVTSLNIPEEDSDDSDYGEVDVISPSHAHGQRHASEGEGPSLASFSVDYDALFQVPSKPTTPIAASKPLDEDIVSLSEHLPADVEAAVRGNNMHSTHQQQDAWSCMIMIMDIMSSMGLPIDAVDGPGDLTFTSVLQQEPEHNASDAASKIFHALFPTSPLPDAFNVVLSIKHTPFTSPMRLQDALSFVGLPMASATNSPQVKNRIKTSHQTRYAGSLSITVALSAHSSPCLHLLKEVTRSMRSVRQDEMHSIAATDCYRKIWKAALPHDTAGMHPVYRSAECIYDLYLGSHLPAAGSSSRNSSMLRAYPLTKHHGICSTSLCVTLSHIPLRMLIQIMMLMLTNHSSIVLISSSSELLTEMRYLLPRLLHPFGMTHIPCFIHTVQQLYRAFGIRKRTCTVYSNDTSSFVRDDEEDNGLSRTYSRRSSQLVQADPNALPAPPSASKSTKHALLPELVPEVVESPENVPSVCFIDAKAYHLTRVDLLNATAEFRRIPDGTLAFDLDSGQLMDYFLISEDSNHSPENTPPSNVCLDLKDPRIFQCANFDALRHLLSAVQRISREYVDAAQVADGDDAAAVTLRTNCQVELAFNTFWTELVLRALPEHIQYYHEYGAMSCDMQSVIAHLLTSNRTSVGHESISPTGYAARRPSSSAQGASWLPQNQQMEVLSREGIERMDFEDFLSFYNDHTGQAGKSLFHAFYADFLAGLSPAFMDLLKKHGQLLDKWQF